MSSKVRVAVRIRPPKSCERYELPCITKEDMTMLRVTNPIVDASTGQRSTYGFDYVLDESDGQMDVYTTAMADMVDAVLGGQAVTVLAYGQTGTGKTYTVLGGKSSLDDQGAVLGADTGLFLRSVWDIASASEQGLLHGSLTALEVYQENVFDLLHDRRKLTVRDTADGILMEGIEKVEVRTVADVKQWHNVAQALRRTSTTRMNDASSRSHALLSLEFKNTKGHLCLVDLAGSERVKKCEVDEQQMKEAVSINQSLSSLGNVIRSLAVGARHVPYRDSKLTRLLKSSFVGNDSRVLLIATVSPAAQNYSETVSTLQFANMIKNIKSGPADDGPSLSALDSHGSYLTLLRKTDEICADVRIFRQLQSATHPNLPEENALERDLCLVAKHREELQKSYVQATKVLENDLKALAEEEQTCREDTLAMEASLSSAQRPHDTLCVALEERKADLEEDNREAWRIIRQGICQSLMRPFVALRKTQLEYLLLKCGSVRGGNNAPLPLIRPLYLRFDSDDAQDDDKENRVHEAPSRALGRKRDPNLPQGFTLVLTATTTWGDRHYIGLTGIDIFDHAGRRHVLSDRKAQVIGNPHSINVLKEHTNDPRTADNVADGTVMTTDGSHMWLAPFTQGQAHTITISLNTQTTRLSALRLWNYNKVDWNCNKSKEHTQRGVKDIELTLDGVKIFVGEVPRAPGNLEGCEECAPICFFSEDAAVHQKIRSHYTKMRNTLREIAQNVKLPKPKAEGVELDKE